MYKWKGGLKGYKSRCNSGVLSFFVYVCLRPVSYMRTEAPYPLGYSEPLFSPAQLRLNSGSSSELQLDPNTARQVVVARAGCRSGWLCDSGYERGWLNMTGIIMAARAVAYRLRL